MTLQTITLLLGVLGLVFGRERHCSLAGLVLIEVGVVMGGHFWP